MPDSLIAALTGIGYGKKASGIPALYLKQHKSVEGVITASCAAS
jgi:dolichol kinase